MKVTSIYFSATNTTKSCVDEFSSAFAASDRAEYNLADDMSAVLPDFGDDDLVIVASPVYGGRLPGVVADRFRQLRGGNAKAVAMVVYGNRDYDDALLELKEMLDEAGFRVVGAGAFIGRHSIFPKVGACRPDAQDRRCIRDFAGACAVKIAEGASGDLRVKGRKPYKKAAGVPLHPSVLESDCVKCGKCAAACPMGAIDGGDPLTTDAAKCISCGRCISVCSRNARRYRGLLYALTGGIFAACFSRRKSPDFYV